MTRDPISLRQAFQFAWPVFKKRYRLFTAILLTIFGAWVILEFVVITGQRFGIVLWILAHLVFLIFFAGVEVGLLSICLALSKGKVPLLGDTFRHMALGPKFLAGQVVYLLMVVAGLTLLIVPGIYLGVRYAVFGFCMAAGEPSLKRSFQQSAILSTGTMTSLFAILVALLFFNLLGACLWGLGLFLTVPLSVLMTTDVYRQMSTR